MAAVPRLCLLRGAGRDDQLRHGYPGGRAGTCGPAPTPPRPAGNPWRAGRRGWSRRSGRSRFPLRRTQARAGKRGQRCCRGSRRARKLAFYLTRARQVPGSSRWRAIVADLAAVGRRAARRRPGRRAAGITRVGRRVAGHRALHGMDPGRKCISPAAAWAGTARLSSGNATAAAAIVTASAGMRNRASTIGFPLRSPGHEMAHTHRSRHARWTLSRAWPAPSAGSGYRPPGSRSWSLTR
jgi:hypothetical protein